MGARGALKLPKHLQAVPNAATAETAADRVPAVAPLKPEAVTANAALSALWDQIVPELDRAGLVTVSDAAAVELALRHFLMARTASEFVGEEISVTDEHNANVKKNPAEAVFRAESEMFLKYAQQLGMTFVSRARTPAAKDGDSDANPFAPGV